MVAMVRGTKTFFNQSTAPTGWTKQTINDDYTLRVVTGSSGGTLGGTGDFSTAFSSSTIWSATAVNAGGLAAAEMADLPAHTHVANYNGGGTTQQRAYFAAGTRYLAYAPSSSGPTGPGGNGTTHAHGPGYAVSGGITGGPAGFEVLYIDFILASKAT